MHLGGNRRWVPLNFDKWEAFSPRDGINIPYPSLVF